MLGEHDMRGFDLLSRRALLTVSLLVAIMIVLMYIPGAVGLLFGVDNPQDMADLDHVLRIFSLMMFPFAITLVLVAVYQVLELILPSVICVIGQLFVLILFTWLFAKYNPSLVWWGFPVSGFLFLMCQLFMSFIYSSRKGHSVSASIMRKAVLLTVQCVISRMRYIQCLKILMLSLRSSGFRRSRLGRSHRILRLFSRTLRRGRRQQ